MVVFQFRISKFKSGGFDNYESEEEGSSHGEKEEEDDIIYEVGVPEAAASMMEVEMMEPEERLGPSLGRVLGNVLHYYNFQDWNIFRNWNYCVHSDLHSRNDFQTVQNISRGVH